MAKKKKGTTGIAAPGGSDTNMSVNQPAENNGHAEEVVVVDNALPAPATSADEAPRAAGNISHESTTSPYTYGPVAIDCGPGLATYWVPKHLLRSLKWSTTTAEGTLCLPGVSAAMGHTLVHYLYTGTYQTLEPKGEDTATPEHIKLKQALLTCVLASVHELQDLKRLAKEQIEIHGSHMAFVEVLDLVRKDFSKKACSLFREYLQAKAKEQFDLDHTFFTSKVFKESVGKGKLHKLMTCHLLELFSEKLTHVLQSQNLHVLAKEKPDAVLDEIENAPVNTHSCHCSHGGHPASMYTASDEMSFDFPDACCEEVDDVISLDDSSVPDCAMQESTIEQLPLPAPAEPESKSVVLEPEPEPVKKVKLKKKKLKNQMKLDAKAKEEEDARRKVEEDVVPQPESEPVEEEPAVDPFAGLSKSQKKKLQERMKRNARAKEEEDAKRKVEEDAVELVRQEKEAEAELVRLEEEEAERMRIEEEEAAAVAAAEAAEAAERAEEERLAQEGEEARIEAEEAHVAMAAEAEAEAARIAENEVEVAKILAEEFKVAQPLVEEEKSPKSSTWAGSIWDSYKKKETAKMRRARKQKEDEEQEEKERLDHAERERLAHEEADCIAAEEHAKFEDEEVEAACITKEEVETARIEFEPVIEDRKPEPEPEHNSKPESILEVSMPESSNTLCPRRSVHLLNGDRWKSCERCRAMLTEIAVQLAKENKIELLGEQYTINAASGAGRGSI